MPLFFFDVIDGVMSPDYVGTDLPTMRDARIQAVRLASEMMRERPQTFVDDDAMAIVVHDERGLVLFQLHSFIIDAPAVTHGMAAVTSP